MLNERNVTKVGFEFEVVAWSRNRTFQDVAKDLIDNNYMVDDGRGWQVQHDYGCKCPAMCGAVRSGDVYDPPMVSLTYDASLPTNGGEFVTSTMLVTEESLHHLRAIWEMVSKDAVWTDTMNNRRETGLATPGFHIHCSTSVGPTPRNLNGTGAYAMADDMTNMLLLFAPELFSLASLAKNTRGLNYRQPSRFPDGERYNHHGFIQVRGAALERNLHVEWRLWEMDYEDWGYLVGATYVSAAITRAAFGGAGLSRLMGAGWLNPYSDRDLREALATDSLKDLLGLIDADRWNAIKNVVMQELQDDEYGQRMVAALFERGEARYGIGR